MPKNEPIKTDPARIARVTRIMVDVLSERENQDAEYGDQINLPDERHFVIAVGEIAEAADAIRYNEPFDLTDLYGEVIQCTACFLAWAESIKARLDRDNPDII